MYNMIMYNMELSKLLSYGKQSYFCSLIPVLRQAGFVPHVLPWSGQLEMFVYVEKVWGWCLEQRWSRRCPGKREVRGWCCPLLRQPRADRALAQGQFKRLGFLFCSDKVSTTPVGFLFFPHCLGKIQLLGSKNKRPNSVTAGRELPRAIRRLSLP